ncbi:MAG: hypothetical protein AB7O62_05130, partial [Pirellulales bacterium]
MTRLLRSVLAVVLGVLAAGLLIGLLEALGHLVFPPPAGLDPSDAASLAQLHAGHFLAVLLAWGVGTLGGAWVAGKVARHEIVTHGLIVGGLLMAAGIWQMLQFPHPVWFWIVGLLEFIPAAYVG